MNEYIHKQIAVEEMLGELRNGLVNEWMDE